MRKLTLAAILAAGCASTEEYKPLKAPGPLFTDSGELMEQAPAVEAKPAQPTQPEATPAAQENPFAKLVDPRAILRGEKPETIPQPKPRPRAGTEPSVPVEYVTLTVKGAYKFSTPSSYGAFLGTFPEGKLNIDAALRASEITADPTADDTELGTYLTGKTVTVVNTDKLGFEFEATYSVPKELEGRFKLIQGKTPAGRLFYHLAKTGKREIDGLTLTQLERTLQ